MSTQSEHRRLTERHTVLRLTFVLIGSLVPTALFCSLIGRSSTPGWLPWFFGITMLVLAVLLWFIRRNSKRIQALATLADLTDQ